MWLVLGVQQQQRERERGTLRHSASFSCLPRERPHRPRAGTLPSDTDYGFVRQQSSPKKESFRDTLMKKGANIWSPTSWRTQKASRRTFVKDVIIEEPDESPQQRRWRSLGALLRLPLSTGNVPPPTSPRAQSFYLLDDFLPRAEHARTASSSDSLDLSASPLPPPIPPPPPALRLLDYRDCSYKLSTSQQDRVRSTDSVRFFLCFLRIWLICGLGGMTNNYALLLGLVLTTAV